MVVCNFLTHDLIILGGGGGFGPGGGGGFGPGGGGGFGPGGGGGFGGSQSQATANAATQNFGKSYNIKSQLVFKTLQNL